MTQQDVIVIGGGMVGAATALGLAKLGLKVVLIEKNPLPTFDPNAPYDVRISAISVASVALLEKLGAWQAIESMRVCPYDGLETWEIDGFNTAFHANDLGLDKLGYMVENNLIQLGLWQALAQYPNCQQAVGFEQISANRDENGVWTVELAQQVFSAPLLIACDGANSLVRRWSGIGLTSWQYRQHCLLAVVKTELPQQSVTWQQFFESGPRAFLPLLEHNGCVVWYDSPQRIAQLQQMSKEKLSAEIQRHFPSRLGKVEVTAHDSFPLTRQHAQSYVRNGIVLVGDSAHTINPLAGQGVNLGFKDVKALLEVIEQAVEKGQNFADEAVLNGYERKRKPDNLLMQTGMDVFYKTFKTDLLPVKVVRNVALIVAERATPLKKRALKYALGII
ncbi:FAD-dependent oxidoreductase [Glaesserella parasuis]|uniref:FAD-dependent oxidoreductase n=1 Tax=Glaesserella parasuis TaxID=738 RepID=UPI00094FCCE0|nr:FAD-dependent oxidoreductase [Glaesserella parasuis]MDG6263292.1 FAD-dependent oxidoreductase [Glaesserella parasuis]MDG6290634.1 FAD-dependent oxidoreductase [Glaesserella parasuis]MDG6292930.1 FAD-dependent oxidoreductase [Glaesserella parasuis]MDG6305110.1 FAD-dependent oxidoreductase [Glaesserella parasuis]MDG6314288.1 FAD-dependent oxidoreductase [Glaesserella parasuis]